MGLMNRMMDRMIASMSVQEREEMMLQMMPVMMKDVEIGRMIPRMLPAMGALLNLAGIATFVQHIAKDEEFKGQVSQLMTRLPHLARKMQFMMAQMRPVMKALMTGMMGFMGQKVMPVMMPVMSEVMPLMMKETMPELIRQEGTAKEYMPAMMMEIIPHCVQNVSPLMKSEDRDAFLARLTESIAQAEGAKLIARHD